MVTTIIRDNGNDSKNSYLHSDSLDQLLKDQLRYFELDNKLRKRIEAGEDISKDEKQELIRIKRNLDKRKVDVLNKHIFRSMANLIVFFDNLAEHLELREYIMKKM